MRANPWTGASAFGTGWRNAGLVTIALSVLWPGVALAARPGNSGPLDAVYEVEGRPIRLVAGRFEEPAAPGSAARMVISVSGDAVYGDLDGNGEQDAVLVLVSEPGGSGTFYYVAAALNRGNRYIGTNAVPLGDRIGPVRITIRKGVVFFEYLDRKPTESMSTGPSVEKTVLLKLIDGRLEVVRSP